MTSLLSSLAMGILVGAIYAATSVKSPAPPIIALLGLLGMVIGEAGFPLLKNFWCPPAVQEKGNSK